MPRSMRFASVLFFFSLFFAAQSHAYQEVDFIREIGEAGKKADQRPLHEPRSIAYAGDRVYIADTDANRVVVLDLSGKAVQAWGAKGDKPGQFRAPAGIALDEQRRVYVADTGNHRVQVFDAGGNLLRSFGEKGSGLREFNSPAGIAAQRGLLYVADTGNSRVQVLTYDGIFMRQIEVKNRKDEMKEPVAVAADVQNRTYVLDAGADKVWIFDQDGSLSGQFGVKGKGTEGFSSPRGLAVDSRGNIYVADTGNYKLKKFDPQGKLVASLGSEGSGPGQFREPSGLAVDNDGKVFVLDAGKHTLQIFSCECGDSRPLTPASPRATVNVAKEISAEASAVAVSRRAWAIVNDSVTAVGVVSGRTIGSRGSEPAMLKNARGLTLDAAGKFWVADTGNDRLQKFSIEGNLLQVIGKSGSGEGEFDEPSAVVLSLKGNVYVADTGNRRVQVFNAKGMFLGAFGKPGKQAGGFSEPVDLAVDRSENVYVVDRGNNRISKYDSDGTPVWETGKAGSQDGEFSGPTNIAVSPDGEVYVLDAGNARVQVFDAGGKFLWKFGSEGKGPGEFKSPQGLALEGSRTLYVGDRGNGRVQVFSLRQVPAVPAGVSAQARPNEVQLSWKSGGESYFAEYKVYRGDSAEGPFTLAGTSTDPFYVDRGLPSNRTLYYRVSSQATEGYESTTSAAVSATTPKLVPAVPRKIRIEAAEKQVTLSWLPNPESFVSHYRVYRSKQPATGFELVDKVDKTVFFDGPLENETVYYYEIAAVGKEGDESPRSEAVFISTPKATLTTPPVEISKIEMGEIFAAEYKYYESHPLGKVVITNNTGRAYPKVKVSFTIKDFMDYATETEIAELAPNQNVDVDLKPVFSNRILEVTENTPLQSELALTYYIDGQARTVTRSFPVTLYQRNAIRWDQKTKVGSFITPKDTVVADFARAVVRPYVDAYPNLHQPIVYARALYDALGVLGFSYILDPTPFQEFSGNSTIVDYTSYPRETLARKSGDCDGLSTLFAAALENIGIGAALIDVPGHVFIMFNTNVAIQDKATLGFADEQLIDYQGTVWIPVEMTMVGSSFTQAWQKGGEEYRDWTARQKADIIDVHKAWELFKPVTLPPADIKPGKAGKDDIEAKYKDELEALGRQRLANLSASYLEELKKHPDNVDALSQLGILYGENGLTAEALEQFQKVLAADRDNATALNNIGNINYLQERLEDAKTAYEASLKAEPGDPGTMANLCRVLLRMGKKDEARKLFQDAAEVDPRVVRQYGDLAAQLGIVK
jgi:sugar lactone lactonase YvrE/transglutaminase-like putative cysteine protease